MTRFDPWRHVDADDDLVADLLAGTVEAVVETGGWLHPAVRFVVRDGQAHVECDAPEGEPLLRVPREAFIRVDRVQWSDSAEALEFDGIPDGFTPTEVELLVLQTAFHNACRKIPWISRTHPVLAPDLGTEVIEAVRAIQPGFRQHQMTAAEVFWSTRAFRMALGEDVSTEKVVVPLIDLLDHDHRGATGSWAGDTFEVAVVHPVGTGECRLDYGHERDVIEMAIVYGFVNEACARAHSAPMVARTTDGGSVVIGDGLRVTFGGEGPPPELDPRAIAAIAEENLQRLDVLGRAAERSQSPAARILAGAAVHQSDIIRGAVGLPHRSETWGSEAPGEPSSPSWGRSRP